MTQSRRALIALRERARAYERSFEAVHALEREWYALEERTTDVALELLARWTAAHLERTGARGFVVGVSGGVDSTLTAIVMQRAAPDACLALWLPAGGADPEDEACARDLTSALQIPLTTLDLAPMVEAGLRAARFDGDRERAVAVGNLAARVRQDMTYFVANTTGRLVLGTSDYDEAFIGYGCKGSASDVSPICGLHKDEVRALIRCALTPVDEALAERLAARPASPGYWPGQRAEDELGMSYARVASALDVLLPSCTLHPERGLFPQRASAVRAAIDAGADPDDLLAVADRITENLHKTMASPSLWREPEAADE